MRRLTAASEYELDLLDSKQYLRFYMLTFDAGLERDPVQATRDYLENRLDSLAPNNLPIPAALRIVHLRRVTYGASPLTNEEIGVLSEALENPTDAIIETSKKLITRHVRLSEHPCREFATLLERFFAVLEGPKRRGRTSEQYANRNSTINGAIKRLVKAGLKKFGGDIPACELVSEELCRLGHPISTDGVRKVIDADSNASIIDEEVNMVTAKALEGMSNEAIRSRDEAWLVLEEIGKKQGYIPSNDRD